MDVHSSECVSFRGNDCEFEKPLLPSVKSCEERPHRSSFELEAVKLYALEHVDNEFCFSSGYSERLIISIDFMLVLHLPLNW